MCNWYKVFCYLSPLLKFIYAQGAGEPVGLVAPGPLLVAFRADTVFAVSPRILIRLLMRRDKNNAFKKQEQCNQDNNAIEKSKINKLRILFANITAVQLQFLIIPIEF